MLVAFLYLIVFITYLFIKYYISNYKRKDLRVMYGIC